MSKTALITAITGQDGAYIARLLLERGYRVAGLLDRRSSSTTWRLEELGVANRVTLIDSDVCDLTAVLRALEVSETQEVYNLAAQSLVATLWRKPVLTANVPSVGAPKDLESIRIHDTTIRFYQRAGLRFQVQG